MGSSIYVDYHPGQSFSAFGARFKKMAIWLVWEIDTEDICLLKGGRCSEETKGRRVFM